MPPIKAVQVYGPRCVHPQARKAGLCGRASVAVVEIPNEYPIPTRHAATPKTMPAQSPVCRQHLARVNAYKAGLPSAAGSHASQCFICQHPNQGLVANTINRWVGWVITQQQASRELGVSFSTFHKHVESLDLWKRHMASGNIERGIAIIAEKGFAAGGHSVRTGLAAMQLLQKHRDRNLVRKSEVNFKGALVTADLGDLARLGNRELKGVLRDLLEQLESRPDDEDIDDDEALLEPDYRMVE